ncbi:MULTISPECIES: GNAT family N-acetyltransferase [unclassified Blastococcus]
MTDTHPLDLPARSALTGPHAHLAERRGRVLRYPADVSFFIGMPARPTPRDWADAAALVGPGGHVQLAGLTTSPPAGWERAFEGAGVQLVDDGVDAVPDPGAVPLTAGDVPEMLALVERTRPGPFLPRTVELGTYLGLRDDDGALVAMAGERLRPPGWTEISAVCTDPAARGRGLATRLVRALVHGIRARRETAFLQCAADNVPAVRLYGALGFRLRREVDFAAARVPGAN